MSPKRKGKKKEKFCKKKFYHEKRRNRTYRKALNSWKKEYPEYFEFIGDRFPFYFSKNTFEKKLKRGEKVGKSKEYQNHKAYV